MTDGVFTWASSATDEAPTAANVRKAEDDANAAAAVVKLANKAEAKGAKAAAKAAAVALRRSSKASGGGSSSTAVVADAESGNTGEGNGVAVSAVHGNAAAGAKGSSVAVGTDGSGEVDTERGSGQASGDADTDSNGAESGETHVFESRFSLEVARGELVAVVGQVGSGKSSLVAAVLGEMTRLGGHVNVDGSVAYVAQTAWIINATLRENVTMGLPYDEARYQKVLEACALAQVRDANTAAQCLTVPARCLCCGRVNLCSSVSELAVCAASV